MTRRSRKRSRRNSRRNNLNKPIRSDVTKSESYDAGMTYGYNYRLQGPVGKVTTTKVDPSTL